MEESDPSSREVSASKRSLAPRAPGEDEEAPNLPEISDKAADLNKDKASDMQTPKKQGDGGNSALPPIESDYQGTPGRPAALATPLRSNVSSRDGDQQAEHEIVFLQNLEPMPESQADHASPDRGESTEVRHRAENMSMLEIPEGANDSFDFLGAIDATKGPPSPTSELDDSLRISARGHRRKVSFGGVSDDGGINIVESLDLLTSQIADDPSTAGDSQTNDSMASLASDSSFIGAIHQLDSNRGILSNKSSIRLLPRESRFLPPESQTASNRISMVADLETGQAGVRGHRVELRDTKSSRQPQSSGARRRRGLRKLRKKLINPFWGVEKEDDSSDDDDDDDDDKSRDSHLSLHGRFMVNKVSTGDADDETVGSALAPQYRLEAIDSRRSSGRRFGGRFGLRKTINLAIYEDTLGSKSECSVFGINPNSLVTSYLSWAFRSSFMAVILSACAAFFLLTIGFAVCIMAIGYNKPDCVHVNGKDFGTTGADFLDAYALSWTTFSTVGYGLVFPGTSNVSTDVKACTGITILTTLESFVGILFASLWGAIFFAKVSRVASVAQVEFSSPIVLKFGAGVLNNDDSGSSSEEEKAVSMESSDSGSDMLKEESQQGLNFKASKLPCPLLEFRILNLRSRQPGGEIIDATMNLVASLDESQASRALRNAVRSGRRRGKKGKKRRAQRRTGGTSRFNRESFIVPTKERLDRAQETIRSLLSSERVPQAIEEDPTGKLIPKRIFAKLEIESQEHPFFKRLWLARHVLNHHSPLVKQEAKELIRLNGGHWPVELNSAEAVRASIHFHRIVVSLSGTSNADANSVYAQKVYDYADLCVGYRFCDILFRESDGSIGVDHSLLNDVREQRGGGGENLLRPPTQSTIQDVLII